MKKLLLLSIALASFAVARPALAATPCATLSMTVTAALSSDPGYEGLYKYTVTGNWDVTQFGLSHIDFFLQLKGLECICDPRVIKFGGGTSTGSGTYGACTVNYVGKYNCMGDPTVPVELRAPTVKFDVPDTSDCRPGTAGSGTWYFYSPFHPGPYTVDPDGAAIKHSQDVCVGSLSGTMPFGDCATATRPTSWGSLKSTYR